MAAQSVNVYVLSDPEERSDASMMKALTQHQIIDVYIKHEPLSSKFSKGTFYKLYSYTMNTSLNTMTLSAKSRVSIFT